MSAPATGLRIHGAPPPDKNTEYRRPDIVLLRTMADASDQIRDELKGLGDERRYITALRVLVGRAAAIQTLGKELIDRYEAAGIEGMAIPDREAGY